MLAAYPAAAEQKDGGGDLALISALRLVMARDAPVELVTAVLAAHPAALEGPDGRSVQQAYEQTHCDGHLPIVTAILDALSPALLMGRFAAISSPPTDGGLKVRITRPRSAGIAGGAHHLHLKAVEVFDRCIARMPVPTERACSGSGKEGLSAEKKSRARFERRDCGASGRIEGCPKEQSAL